MVSARVLLAGTYVLTGLLALVLFPYVLDNREKPGATGLGFLLAGACIWSLSTAVVTLATTAQLAFVGENLTSLGAAILGTGWVLMAAEYAGFIAPSRSIVGVVLGIAVIPQQVVAWTDPLHGFYYRSISPSATLTSVSTDFGPMYWAIIVVAYVFFAVGSSSSARRSPLAACAGYRASRCW